jgi:hypothetical protein
MLGKSLAVVWEYVLLISWSKRTIVIPGFVGSDRSCKVTYNAPTLDRHNRTHSGYPLYHTTVSKYSKVLPFVGGVGGVCVLLYKQKFLVGIYFWSIRSGA